MATYRITENGNSSFHITTHRYADETVRYAASELQKYILMATNTDIPYFSDRCPSRGPEIKVGADVRDMTNSELPKEEFRIHDDGTNIYIEGGRMKWFNFHHSFRDLVPAEKYFETHPEYFAEIDLPQSMQCFQACMRPTAQRVTACII